MTLITWEDTFKQIDDKVKAFRAMADISAAALKEALRRCDEKDAEIAELKRTIKAYEYLKERATRQIGEADHDER